MKRRLWVDLKIFNQDRIQDAQKWITVINIVRLYEDSLFWFDLLVFNKDLSQNFELQMIISIPVCSVDLCLWQFDTIKIIISW